MENTPNLLPEMSEKFDMVLKNIMLAKKEMGSTVKKDAANPFHKSRYASLGAHLELCEGVLDKHGLILMQTVNGSHDKAIMIATICHVESGQWIKSYLPLPNPKNDSQGLGASITYMRRYSINSMLGLTAEDDDGETAAGRGKHDDYKKEQKAAIQNTKVDFAPKKIAGHQVAKLKEIEAKLDDEFKRGMMKRMLTNFQVNNLEDIVVDHYATALSSYENALKYMEQKQREVVNA